MDGLVREALLKCDPFAKLEDLLEWERPNEWDVVLYFKDGRRFLYDGHTKFHKTISYGHINELTDEQEKKEFAYMLRIIMERKFVTQEELAAKVGTSQTMISHYTSGRSLPSVLMVRKIAKVLNCSMDDFFPKNY